MSTRGIAVRRCCAAICLALVFAAPSWTRADVTFTRSTHLDLPAVVESMPEGGATTDFQPGHVSVSNLGGFTINLIPNGTLATNLPALAAFTRAANQWVSYISDPITVTIEANLDSLPANVIGSTNSVTLIAGYTSIRNQMVADAADEPDDVIAGFLPTIAQFTGFLPSGFAFGGGLTGTKANLKALGFTGLDLPPGSGGFGLTDAEITFSTNFPFDFDNSNGVSGGTMDFETVAVHEIGHALGFISEVDYVDFVLSQSQTANDVAPTTLDMFRFAGGANDPTSTATFTTRPRSLVTSVSAPAHFDQVLTTSGAYGPTEVLLSMGDATGDGEQASHWKDNLNLGVMDPTLAFGEISPIRLSDLRAFDLIGYEIAMIPEAGAWLFGGVAACVAGAGAWWHRRKTD